MYLGAACDRRCAGAVVPGCFVHEGYQCEVFIELESVFW